MTVAGSRTRPMGQSDKNSPFESRISPVVETRPNGVVFNFSPWKMPSLLRPRETRFFSPAVGVREKYLVDCNPHSATVRHGGERYHANARPAGWGTSRSESAGAAVGATADVVGDPVRPEGTDGRRGGPQAPEEGRGGGRSTSTHCFGNRSVGGGAGVTMASVFLIEL